MRPALIGQLATNLAHEVNTPIQFVGDGLDFVRDALGQIAAVLAVYRRHHGALPPEAARELEVAITAADLDYHLREAPPAIEACIAGVAHIAELVRTVRVAAHPSRPPPEPVDLAPLVARALAATRPRLSAATEVTVTIPAGLPPVAGHRPELERVFFNLLTNAADAVGGRGGNGRIAITAAAMDATIVAEVADTGGGIPPAIRDRVFEPYVTTKSIGQGGGLGLALAHAIVVDLHRGQLGFRCDDVGTTFAVTLPRARLRQA